MAVYDTSELRKGIKVIIDAQPYQVLEAQFVKPGKGAAFTRTLFKNLLTSRNIERNIRSGEKIEQADIDERAMSFLYKEGDDFVFMDQVNYEQINVLKEAVGEDWRWLKDNTVCQLLFWNGKTIGLQLPNFIDLKIVSSEPGARGDTSGNVKKPAVLETGATIGIPLFVNEGDTIRIDTRSGEYCERVKS